MRLPNYSHLLALSAGPLPLLRLLETIVVAVSALVSHRLFGNRAFAGYDSAVMAFAIIFAWSVPFESCVRSRTRRQSLLRAVVLPALGRVLCEAGAACMIRWMHPGYEPSIAWLIGLAVPTAAGVIVCRLADRIARAPFPSFDGGRGRPRRTLRDVRAAHREDA